MNPGNQGPFYYSQQQQQQPQQHVGIPMPGEQLPHASHHQLHNVQSSSGLNPYFQPDSSTRRNSQEPSTAGPPPPVNRRSQSYAKPSQHTAMAIDTNMNAGSSSADVLRMAYTPQPATSPAMHSATATPQHQYSVASSYPLHQSAHRQSASFSGTASASMSNQSITSMQDVTMRQAPATTSAMSMDGPYPDTRATNRHSTLMMPANFSINNQGGSPRLGPTSSTPQSPLIQLSPVMSTLSNQHSPSTNTSYPTLADSQSRGQSYSPAQFVSTSPYQSRPQPHRSPTQPMTNSFPVFPSAPSRASTQMHQLNTQYASSPAALGYDMLRSQSHQTNSSYSSLRSQTQSASPTQTWSSPVVPQQSPQAPAEQGFRRVRDVSDLASIANPQPAGRRANPTGGFISVRL